MSEKITVYEKPTCSKCREMNKFLKDSGLDYEKINYYTQPFTQAQLEAVLKKLGIGARELLRTTEAIYKDLKLAKAALSDSELVALMVEHPDLVQRPIVVRGERAVIGRPTENVQALL